MEACNLDTGRVLCKEIIFLRLNSSDVISGIFAVMEEDL